MSMTIYILQLTSQFVLAAARAIAAFYFAIKVRCYSPFSLHGKTVYLEVRPFCQVNSPSFDRYYVVKRFNFINSVITLK